MMEPILFSANWIKPASDMGDVVPLFTRRFHLGKKVASAVLYITCTGVYEACLNGSRVGRFLLAPGWTSYEKRLQYQQYDVTALLKEDNALSVLVGKGWYRSPMPGFSDSDAQNARRNSPACMIAQLHITCEDGTEERILTDPSWRVSESCIRFSEIYDGEVCDASFCDPDDQAAVIAAAPPCALIPQEGEEIQEQERVLSAKMFTTPKGEVVIDFGQEVTGYVETTLTAAKGELVELSFAEVLDRDGNFYNANYRTARCRYRYTCTDGRQTYKPRLTFYGFRYIRIDAFPGGPDKAYPEAFTAVVIHSALRRTGWLSCSDPLLNQLFSNIAWGQKGNFVDVPTDCPQRDERLGWTGDAQVFVKTACYFYDVEKFFAKWLKDMAADQLEDGSVGVVIPDLLLHAPSAAWGDAATICPWEIYLAYGDPAILRAQFTCMRKWVDYITAHTTTPFLWTGGTHYGDWLGLDAPSGSYKGSSREAFIASAFYAHSTSLTVKAGKVLGIDVSFYERLYDDIVRTFKSEYTEYRTQTECVLAAHFGLTDNPQQAADQLADRIVRCGNHLETGFVGTPYLLHVLSKYGHTGLAYSLLLRREYPGWLYAVTKGATTVWEHWDGIMENGDFWSTDMNSFNHYAYGSVADWVYGVAAGIQPDASAPGYARVKIAPEPDCRLDWLKASFLSRRGLISSSWAKEGTHWRYEITTPVEADITIAGRTRTVAAGSYIFFSDIESGSCCASPAAAASTKG